MWRVVLMVALCLTPVAARACIVIGEPDLRTISLADLVAVGEVTDYTLQDPLPDEYHDDYLVMTIRVERWLKGESSGVVRVAWRKDSNSRAPVAIADQKIVFAAYPVGEPDRRSQSFGYDWWDHAEWFLARQWCATDLIDGWSREREAAWRKLANTEFDLQDKSAPIDPNTFEGPDLDLTYDYRTTAERRRFDAFVKWGPLGIVILFIAAALSWQFMMSARRKADGA